MTDDKARLAKTIAGLTGEIEKREAALDEAEVEQAARLEGEITVLRRRRRHAEADLARVEAEEAEAEAKREAECRAALLTLERAALAVRSTPLHVEMDELRAAAARVGGVRGPNSKLAKAARDLAEAIAHVHEAAEKLAEVKAG